MEKDLFEEYMKFLKKDVKVTYNLGNKVETLEGNLIFLNFNYLNCVLITDTQIVIIKNIIAISRKRKQS